MRDDGPDRDAILLRRALLVSSALAALQCSASNDGTGGLPTQTSATSVASQAASASGAPDMPAPLPAWKDVLAAAPPRGVPPAVGEAERGYFESQEQVLTDRYAAVQAVWEALPACDAADPSCRPMW